MKKFKVISFWDTEDPEVYYLDEKELRELANYYYNNSDVEEDIVFDNVDLKKVIEFIERVDKVEQI